MTRFNSWSLFDSFICLPGWLNALCVAIATVFRGFHVVLCCQRNWSVGSFRLLLLLSVSAPRGGRAASWMRGSWFSGSLVEGGRQHGCAVQQCSSGEARRHHGCAVGGWARLLNGGRAATGGCAALRWLRVEEAWRHHGCAAGRYVLRVNRSAAILDCVRSGCSLRALAGAAPDAEDGRRPWVARLKHEIRCLLNVPVRSGVPQLPPEGAVSRVLFCGECSPELACVAQYISVRCFVRYFVKYGFPH